MTPDLSVELMGCRLKNPTILASGVLGTTHDILKRVAQGGAGAVTSGDALQRPKKLRQLFVRQRLVRVLSNGAACRYGTLQ